MKNFKLYFSLFIALFLFYSCKEKINNVSSSSERKVENTDNTSETKNQTQTQGNMIRAKFVEFRLGDASHFFFTDDTGKEWDFAANDDESFEFAVELPAKEITEENQGWGSNKDLQGKWFNIKYEFREMPQYQDGPMATLPIIVEVKPE